MLITSLARRPRLVADHRPDSECFSSGRDAVFVSSARLRCLSLHLCAVLFGALFGLAGGPGPSVAQLPSQSGPDADQNGPEAPPRGTFVRIASGSVTGSYFQMADVLAGLISHPPGSTRCAMPDRCGPEGLIAVAQASEGSVRNVVEINSRAVDMGLAQADVVAWAQEGTRLFADLGAQTSLRAIANLYPETVHLVARYEAPIVSLADLEGKRISIDRAGSGTNATANLIFDSLGLDTAQIDLKTMSPGQAAAALAEGELDAFFFTAGAPVPIVKTLIEAGQARLVPIAGQAMAELVAITPAFQSMALPDNTYPGQPGIETISVGALWITHDGMSPTLVDAIVRALWNDANAVMLEVGHPLGNALSLENAVRGLPLPLHEGAVAFYREAGVLPQEPIPGPELGLATPELLPDAPLDPEDEPSEPTPDQSEADNAPRRPPSQR